MNFQEACKSGDLEGVKYYLEKNDVIYDNMICLASMNNRVDVVKLLLEDGRVDPTIENNLALYLAIKEGHVRVVKVLLEDGRVVPNMYDNNCIWLATRMGFHGIVKILLKYLDPSIHDNICISNAAWNGCIYTMGLLLADPRVDPTAQNYRAVKYACFRNKVEVLEMLLDDDRVNVWEVRKMKTLNPIISRYISRYIRRRWKALLIVIGFTGWFSRWKGEYYAPGGIGFQKASKDFYKCLEGL